MISFYTNDNILYKLDLKGVYMYFLNVTVFPFDALTPAFKVLLLVLKSQSVQLRYFEILLSPYSASKVIKKHYTQSFGEPLKKHNFHFQMCQPNDILKFETLLK